MRVNLQQLQAQVSSVYQSEKVAGMAKELGIACSSGVFIYALIMVSRLIQCTYLARKLLMSKRIHVPNLNFLFLL